MDMKKKQHSLQQAIYNDVTCLGIRKPPTGDIEDRLHIYREGYYLRLIEVLGIDYGCLERALGESLFANLARAYIKENPSTDFSLESYGKNFWQYVSEHHAEKWGELARFERQLAEFAVIAKSETLAEQTLINLSPDSWPSLVFTFEANSECIHFNYDVIAAFDSNGQEFPARNNTVLFWQKNAKAYFRELNGSECQLIEGLNQGYDFASLCEYLCEFMEEQEVPYFAASTLRSFVLDKLIMPLNYAK